MLPNWSPGLSLVLLAALSNAAPLSSGGEFELARTTIDGGGGRSSGGVFVLEGSIGQPDAGHLGGGVHQLRGGFQTGGDPVARPDLIFADGFEP